LAAALVFGTFWFWVVIVTAFIVITALEEHEQGIFALIALMVTLVTLNLSMPVFRTLIFNPKRTILLIAAYFVVGAVWGFVKWFLYVTRELERYNEAKATILYKHKASALTQDTARELKEYISDYGMNQIELNPQVREHKSDIMRWMIYWPFSGLWTLVNDPVRRAFRFIYTKMQATMQAVSDRMFKNAADDMKLAGERPTKAP